RPGRRCSCRERPTGPLPRTGGSRMPRMAGSSRSSNREGRKHPGRSRAQAQAAEERQARDKQVAEHIDGISPQEIEEIEDLSSPRAPIIYEIVRRMGEEELQRPITSLWWSGVAAGLSISFSIVSQGILRLYLPDYPL